MRDVKRVVVFGGTGSTGRHVVAQALERGHEVTVLVRDAAKVADPHPRLRVEVGDVTDEARVAQVIEGQDAVVCALGAPARSQARVRERGTRNIVRAMGGARVRRLVAMSTYGLGETRRDLPFFVRYVIVPLYLARAFADHEAQEAVIRDSDLDWSIVRPPFLTDDPATGQVRHDLGRGDKTVKWKISRADVATVLLDQALGVAPRREILPVSW